MEANAPSRESSEKLYFQLYSLLQAADSLSSMCSQLQMAYTIETPQAYNPLNVKCTTMANDERLEIIDQNISILSAVEQKMRDTRLLLQDFRNRALAPVAINLLPDEIIQKIIVEGFNAETTEFRMKPPPLALGHIREPDIMAAYGFNHPRAFRNSTVSVCRRWRAISISTAHLWSLVSLYDRIPAAVVIRQLRRSKDAPLNLALCLDHPIFHRKTHPSKDEVELLSVMKTAFQRCRSLHINVAAGSDMEYAAEYLTQAPAPALTDGDRIERSQTCWECLSPLSELATQSKGSGHDSVPTFEYGHSSAKRPTVRKPLGPHYDVNQAIHPAAEPHT